MRKIAGLLLLFFLMGGEVCFYFSPDRKVEIEGKVEAVRENQRFCRSPYFVVLEVKDGGGKIFRVYTSPRWFFTLRPQVGEKVKIKGAFWDENKEYVIAEWIYFRGEKIYLRDERGFPLWSRRLRRGRLARKRFGKPWEKGR